MSDFIFEKLTRKQFLIQLIVPFLTTLFFLQGFRTYIVNLYIVFFNILWEETGYYLPLLSLVAIGAPLLGILAHKKISLRNMIAGSALCTTLFAIPISLQLPYEIELLLASLVISFFAIYLPFHLYQHIQDESEISIPSKAALISTSIILAFTYDILIRSLATTSDPFRGLSYFPLQLFLAILVFVFVIWDLRQQTSSKLTQRLPTDNTTKSPITSRLAGTFIIASLGVIFFLEHTLLINPHNILRWTNPEHFLLDLTLVFTSTIIIMIIGVIIVTHPKIRTTLKLHKWQTLAIENLFIITAIVLMFFVRTSFFLVLFTQIGIIINLFTIIQYAIQPKLQWSSTSLSIAFFLAMLILILWDFMYAFTYTYAYLGDIGVIFAGQTLTILLLAAIILSITSSFAAYKLGRLTI